MNIEKIIIHDHIENDVDNVDQWGHFQNWNACRNIALHR
jgi:hypothetical protein